MQPAQRSITLDDKYKFESERVFMTGTQALVRLLLAQRMQDRAAGLDTAGFVSGYRGSPLGGFDRELWRAHGPLESENIRFWPGTNEDLAATAVWGTQQIDVLHRSRHQGVFGMWYGKGAGLDRSTDPIRHAHAYGTSKYGGVLVVSGDDHALKSSTNPYHCEPTFSDLLMPVLYPSSISEMIDFGLLGFAMSRFSGCWVGFKTLAEYLDATGTVEVRTAPLQILQPPTGDRPPAGSVHGRWPDPWPAAEDRLVRFKLPAARAFARANGIDRVVLEGRNPRLGIVAAGKSYTDLRQAMLELGLSDEHARGLGLSIYKVGMPWPLEGAGIEAFARSVPEILVIEEKRGLIEDQIKAILYGMPAEARPHISGKNTLDGAPQLSWVGELEPETIARVLAERIGVKRLPERGRQRLAIIDRQRQLMGPPLSVQRSPYFCSGCPHNTSTRVPADSKAFGGVGCHGMVVSMDRSTATFTQMGGEGVTWIGQAPFADTEHMFVNLGDGTYFHSGSLAIRACLAAKVNITFKLLFNDAVAMTGGQPVDGQITVPRMAQQLRAEGVEHIVVVTDEPGKYVEVTGLPKNIEVRHRRDLDAVQRDLREIKGVSALIYDQTCAAEKRRRRKSKQFADPARRVFINSLVCEGCGDCQAKSNCLSVVPVDTEFGRKRQIDQSSCNKDFSCLEGFCPSFITVEGGQLKKPAPQLPKLVLPEPTPVPLDGAYDIFITGVGGTGVVTVGALLGMAAHIEGKGASIMDVLGMAQKGGPVVSHVRLAPTPADLFSVRVPQGGADLLLACDILVAAQTANMRRLSGGKTHAIINTHETITGDALRDPDAKVPVDRILASLQDLLGQDCVEPVEASRLATGLIGDAIGTNLFMMGFAYQRGRIPLSLSALEQAIRLNGGGVEANLETFRWGRRAAMDLATVRDAAGQAVRLEPKPQSLAQLIAHRAQFLERYQNAAYSARYRNFVESVERQERAQTGGEAFSHAVAKSLFKLMAYKDEYEVARLFTEGDFLNRTSAQFEGHHRIRFHLAPPIFSRRDPQTGHLRKQSFGAWVIPMFRILARLKILRGTLFDPFGYTQERRTERNLIGEYRSTIEKIAKQLRPENAADATAIAEWPMAIRGFGHVKERNLKEAEAKLAGLLDDWLRNEQPVQLAAE
ncbi:indolepyruvate ferredoxin oxidoreductase family protein [Pseudaminobacter soli (ex Li et al. 2025)]|uniref:Indolepyruvate ferredoxin oxidoreductase family protein n=1 Tax=Pseudaminobacter soli (ex Li et al. 2025) TaxID=1295366 RepID=A0A2P7S337_9HYPH|nr:indolepyruvate ferredoxin oxidoreductase family protein [Mesorhizobium soli]PSJ56895.1 indolepyruvate ferredoxin oxidoreductase family protein [Mesorhizobium soli]